MSCTLEGSAREGKEPMDGDSGIGELTGQVDRGVDARQGPGSTPIGRSGLWSSASGI